MKFVDEFRDPRAIASRLDALRRIATRRWTIMEVCGGQTHNLLRYGIPQAIEEQVELLHGPGCPVCVTPVGAIDFAIQLALTPGHLVASFGDMLRVPGSSDSLLAARARGAAIRVVYSPLDAVALAQRQPEQQVVFFAVGFETTAPATALAVLHAEHARLDNFSLLTTHVRVLPAMEQVARAADRRVEGFLAAGHVCTVTGSTGYDMLAEEFRLPVVVTGFEPTDLLDGLLTCVQLLESGEATVCNAYQRVASPAGNRHAQQIVAEVFEPCDRNWRGMGQVTSGGLRLREQFRAFDAEQRFPGCRLPTESTSLCRAGEVLTGQLRPSGCPYFGRECTPSSPWGAPMVSEEGACAAYFRYANSVA